MVFVSSAHFVGLFILICIYFYILWKLALLHAANAFPHLTLLVSFFLVQNLIFICSQIYYFYFSCMTWILYHVLQYCFYFIYWLIFCKRGGRGGISVCCSIYLRIYQLLFVCALTEFEPTTLVHWVDALSNWATRPGPIRMLFVPNCFKLMSQTHLFPDVPSLCISQIY